MSQLDTRPRWMLRKQARISARRLSRFGRPADKLTTAEWWQQIGEAAVDLALEPGPFADWQAWPAPSASSEDPL